jgi:hypothetical protein
MVVDVSDKQGARIREGEPRRKAKLLPFGFRFSEAVVMTDIHEMFSGMQGCK